jgi:hypothetical protein
MGSVDRRLDTDGIQQELVRDLYLQHSQSADARRIHMFNKYVSRIDPMDWARENRDIAFLELRNKVRSEMGCSLKEAHQIAVGLERDFASVLYWAVDRMLRPMVAEALVGAADRLERLADDPQTCKELLQKIVEELSSDLGDQTAKLQAYGLTREEATGLAIHLKNFGLNRTMRELVSPGGLSMHKSDPMCLADFQQSLRRSAGEMRTLAANLQRNRSVPVLEIFPAFAEGLSQGIDSNSFLAHVMDNHASIRGWEKRELDNLARCREGIHSEKWLKNCLKNAGTAVGTWLAKAPAVGNLTTCISVASDLKEVMDDDRKARRPVELSYQIGGMSEKVFLEKSRQADHDLGVAIFGVVLENAFWASVTPGL